MEGKKYARDDHQNEVECPWGGDEAAMVYDLVPDEEQDFEESPDRCVEDELEADADMAHAESGMVPVVSTIV